MSNYPIIGQKLNIGKSLISLMSTEIVDLMLWRWHFIILLVNLIALNLADNKMIQFLYILEILLIITIIVIEWASIEQ
jgi:hypothetical protein